MKTVKTSRALALGVTAALAASALPFTAASAAPLPEPDSLVAASKDGAFFELSDYAAGDITVQVLDDAQKNTDVDDTQDLTYTWTVKGYGANAAPVVLPAVQQKTDVNGRFEVALPANAGPGTYSLDAELALDGQGATLSAPDALVVAVGNASADDDSTAVVTGLGSSTPGLVENGTLTVTAPDGTYGVPDGQADPVVGQVYALTVDHGFFTGGEPVMAVGGTEAGQLSNIGTRFTGVTNSAGKLTFKTGIARDTGFDDDGRVATTVKVANGPAASGVTSWSTDKTLNGRVAIRPAPASEQSNPVNPTLAGNQTYYDVFALDQYGNPVDDQPIDLAYSGRLKDYIADDDFFRSNFDTIGDIFVVSNVADQITVTGTWEAAPKYVYLTTGGAPERVDEDDLVDATGSTSTTTYEISFNGSSYSMSSSVSDTVRVGTTVTQTVRAVDQQGNPIEGFQVRFLRFGPDATNGDVVATKSTNALGEATYSFIGTRRGRALITAEITDGNRRKELNGSAAFGAAVNARLARTKGKSSGGRVDRLTVSATKLAKGARVNLYKVVKGKQKLVGSKKLGSKGTAAFAIRDRNRKAKTKYVAVVRSTSSSIADQSRAVNVR